MRVRHLAAAVLALGLVTTGGCLSPVDPSSVRIAAIRVTIGDQLRDTDTIRVRRTTRVQATAFASQGYDLGVTSFTYTSSDPAVATVDQDGLVRGISPGTATITVRAPQGRSAAVTVVVRTTTVEFTITLGGAPGSIAFSQDYARAYVTAGDSVTLIDAFGFFRLRSLALGLTAGQVAATGDAVFITHPANDSVSVISVGSNTLVRRLALPGSPDAVVATASRAFVAARTGRTITALTPTGAAGTITLAGAPQQLAVARSGSRLFATAANGTSWTLVSTDVSTLAVLRTIALPEPARALATNADGSRVYVLLASGGVRAFDVATTGAFTPAGSATAGAGATGIAVRLAGPPDVVVSGEPVVILDGSSLAVIDRIAGAGTGSIAIRPDGLFAFVAAPDRRTVNVIGL